MKRIALAIVAVVAGLLLAVPGAQAATFCVGSPSGCSGIELPGGALDEALSTASLNGEPDLVRIGAGTYTPGEPGGWEFLDSAHGIDIRGEGPTETILDSTGAGATTLQFAGAGEFESSVRDLGVKLSAAGGTPTGLVLAEARAVNVAVTAPAGLTAGLGVRLEDGHSTFANGRVDVPGLRGVESSGIALVLGSSIRAEVALMATSGAVGIAHANIETSRIGILSAGQLSVFDTLIHVSGGAGIEYGVLGTNETTVRHVTMVGTGAPTYGMRAYRQGGGSALHTLDNSTVTGFENDLSAGADGLSLASIAVKYSNYATKLVSPGGVVNPTGDVMNVAPGFGDPAAGNFHLRHDSPLVDAGRVVGTMNNVDLAGLPRIVDGNAADGEQPDIGAYEYQRAAPAAAIEAPASATVGQTIDMSGAGSTDPDAADALTYNWWFGDGATATGPTASHAYSAPGTYAVTLQVTDPTGQERTVTKSIVVAAGAGDANAGDAATAGDAGDPLAPVISRLRVLPARRLIRFRLSEPAQVTIRLTRRGAHRVARSLRVSGRTGANKIRLRRRLVRALAPGRYRIKVSARDAAGNQANRGPLGSCCQPEKSRHSEYVLLTIEPRRSHVRTRGQVHRRRSRPPRRAPGRCRGQRGTARRHPGQGHPDPPRPGPAHRGRDPALRDVRRHGGSGGTPQRDGPGRHAGDARHDRPLRDQGRAERLENPRARTGDTCAVGLLHNRCSLIFPGPGQP